MKFETIQFFKYFVGKERGLSYEGRKKDRKYCWKRRKCWSPVLHFSTIFSRSLFSRFLKLFCKDLKTIFMSFQVVDMADQGQEESELFSRRNAIESSPMSDSTTMDSVVSDSQRNEQQDEKSSPSYLETINTPAIQILDENTNMEFEEETFQQTHTTEKQISIEMTEEQVTDTDIKLQEELMKETGIVYTKTKSLQNDSEIKATFSRESSMDLTEESSNQIADPLPDQLDDAKEDEAMDEVSCL